MQLTNASNCLECGVQIHKEYPTVQFYKSKGMGYQCLVPPSNFIRVIQNKSNPINNSKKEGNSIASQMSEQFVVERPGLVEWMLKLGIKLKVSMSSVHMAVYLVDCVLSKKDVSFNQFEIYAAVAIMLAAKTQGMHI